MELDIQSYGVSLSATALTPAAGPLGPARVVPCPPGTTDPVACRPCAAGTYAIDCGVSSCSACAPGGYSGPGAALCSPCPAGSYTFRTGSTICTACPTGQVYDFFFGEGGVYGYKFFFFLLTR